MLFYLQPFDLNVHGNNGTLTDSTFKYKTAKINHLTNNNTKNLQPFGPMIVVTIQVHQVFVHQGNVTYRDCQNTSTVFRHLSH